MATLSTPTVTLGATTADKRDVTVAGTMNFDASDVGRTYRLEIKLYGEDLSGDKLPSSDSGADDLISTFMTRASSKSTPSAGAARTARRCATASGRRWTAIRRCTAWMTAAPPS